MFGKEKKNCTERCGRVSEKTSAVSCFLISAITVAAISGAGGGCGRRLVHIACNRLSPRNPLVNSVVVGTGAGFIIPAGGFY